MARLSRLDNAYHSHGIAKHLMSAYEGIEKAEEKDECFDGERCELLFLFPPKGRTLNE